MSQESEPAPTTAVQVTADEAVVLLSALEAYAKTGHSAERKAEDLIRRLRLLVTKG